MSQETRPRPRRFLDCFRIIACPPTRKVEKGTGVVTFEFACGVTVTGEVAEETLFDGYQQTAAKRTHLSYHPETQV